MLLSTITTIRYRNQARGAMRSNGYRYGIGNNRNQVTWPSEKKKKKNNFFYIKQRFVGSKSLGKWMIPHQKNGAHAKTTVL